MNVIDPLHKHEGFTFRTMIDSIPNPLILINQEGKIVYINTYTEHLLQYQKDEIIGRNIETVIPKWFNWQHYQYLDFIFKDPEVKITDRNVEIFGIRKNKNKIPLEIKSNTIDTSDGKMILISLIDISERKKTENTLEKHIKKLKNKNKELEQFNYIASHDLQEPLKSISSLTTMITDEYRDHLNEEIKNSFTFLHESTSRMKNLISALLDYGRLGRHLELKQINCNTLIREVIDDFSTIIKDFQIEFKIGDLPIIYGYRTELKVLFENLISNAIKFRKKHVPTIIEISAQKQLDTWFFSIKDNGIGMNMKFINKIFTIFQQLNSKEEYSGTGIGLSHCKKIVEIHDGDIWVESVPGRGSSFYFTINIKI
ncbi:PAS domain-containing sensor histidine kinase [Aquimarina sp. AD10]|uniref:histidine kinase n=1 Tax=Aquimarina aggregata TaxID=1642818 RepID=A0A163A7Q8_9FLAO|nr:MULTISPECIES: ATP-binding protein [Aquimarina]AXT63341.1 PAS domain-containing sensor histidine kinase [Aquimarina sp. AD10]KZS40328.1 hypothetical protein AWE51_05065 [Aquimarina aggregata]RKN00646.1 PAS domain-containing sensor histidine kinase [Aquimarina sp. AD10]